MQDIKAKLAENLDEAEWQWFKPHAARDRVLVVDLGLNLLDVGEAIARDRVSSVQHWISEQLLYKPTVNQLETWEDRKRFQALIVQPYLLVQETES